MKKYGWTAHVAACLLFPHFMSVTYAASLQFNLATSQGADGLISYAGGANPLAGMDIAIADIEGIGTPANDGIAATCINCTLDFTTGNYNGFAGDTWDFLSGGALSISGGVDFPDSTTDITDGSTLLSGSFTDAALHDHSSGEFHLHIDGATFTDTKHSSLTAFYGMPDSLYTGGMTITFRTVSGITPGMAFDSDIINSGSVINQAVPIPATAWLFVSGLIGLTGMAKRSKSA